MVDKKVYEGARVEKEGWFGWEVKIPVPKSDTKIYGVDLPKEDQRFPGYKAMKNAPSIHPSYMHEHPDFALLDRLNKRIDLLEGKLAYTKKAERTKNQKKYSEELTQIKNERSKWNKRRDRLWEKQIAYIEQEWEFCRKGFFFMNFGELTYVTGRHYHFLRYYKLKEADERDYPEYRDRDQRFYIFWDNVWLDDRCLGIVYPKHRREGATAKAASSMLYVTTKFSGKASGIQSKTREDAEAVFAKQMHANKNLMWWMAPISAGSDSPLKKIEYDLPSSQSLTKDRKEENFTRIRRVPEKLDPTIYFQLTGGISNDASCRSSKIKAYASKKLNEYLSDEEGATDGKDVISKRSSTVKPCLKLGAKVIGKSFHIAAVEAMSSDSSGPDFKNLFLLSMPTTWDKDTRKTVSGYKAFFIPACYGLEGFIDSYGRSDIKAATEYLEAESAQLRKAADKDKSQLGEYYKQQRLFPLNWKKAFLLDSSVSTIPTDLCQQRIDFINDYGNRNLVRGSLSWLNGYTPLKYWKDERKDKQLPKVIWTPTTTGNFAASGMPPAGQQNRVAFINDEFIPLRTNKGAVGADPYHFDITEQGKLSEGGIAYCSSPSLFDIITPSNEHSEDIGARKDKEIAIRKGRLLMTYSHRPRKLDHFCDDILKMCWLHGSLALHEKSTDKVIKYFKKQKCYAFLQYIRGVDGKCKNLPGVMPSGQVRDDLFSEVTNYLHENSEYEAHIRFLEQSMEVTFGDTTDYDLWMAAGYAIMGSRNTDPRYEHGEQETTELDLMNLYERA